VKDSASKLVNSEERKMHGTELTRQRSIKCPYWNLLSNYLLITERHDEGMKDGRYEGREDPAFKPTSSEK